MNDVLFGNNNKTIIKKLSKRSTQSDRKSTLFLILTIALSVCMVLSIALISAGMNESYKNQYRNKSQITVIGPTDNQLTQMREATDIEWVGEYSALGFSYQDDITLSVIYENSEYVNREKERGLSGTMPEATDEILLEQGYIDHFRLDCKVGDTILLDLTGTGKQSEYKITGILSNSEDENGIDYAVIISKALAQKLAEDTSGGILQITAYVKLNTNETSFAGLSSFANQTLEPIGIESGQIYMTDYFAIMNGVIRNGLNISIPTVAFVTFVLAALVIYGVFYTMITKNVQTFGQLRTIGTTKRQIKKMVRMNGFAFAVKGILLGLVFGIIIGFAVCPDGFVVATTIKYCAAISVMAAFVVMIVIGKPARIASKTSPIEGTRFLSYSGKTTSSRKVKRKISPARLALLNISRNKRKAVFMFLTLSISGIIFLTTATVAGSIDAEKEAQFRSFPDGQFQLMLRNVESSTFDSDMVYNYSTKLQLENNPFDDSDLIQQLCAVDGVEKVTPHNAIIMEFSFSSGLMEVLQVCNYNPTISKEEFSIISTIVEGCTTDYDGMTEINGVLAERACANVGDTISVTLRGEDGSRMTVDVPVVGIYDTEKLMDVCPVVPGSPYILMTYDTAKKLTGVSAQTGVLSVEVSDSQYDSALSKLNHIANEQATFDVNDISSSAGYVKSAYNYYIKNMYLISFILFLFGGIGLTNTLLVDFRNRKIEFGLLQAVGMTQKQVRKMVHKELQVYLGGSLAIAIIGGAVASTIFCHKLNVENHCISFQLPWLFIFGLLIMLAGIYLMCSAYISSELKKSTILASIRD